MSSSNSVRIAFIEESTYGVTPVAGNFTTARFISESLSGTPETVESQQIRTDRMSSGQIVTGLTVEGDLEFELAKEASLDNLMESAMYNDWSTMAVINADLSYNSGTKELTRAAGSWITDGIVVGDFATLGNFANAGNNTQVMVAEVVSATVLRLSVPTGMVTESDTGNTFQRADKLTIGTTKKSFSMEKAFLDLTTKAINYKGMIVSGMSLNVAYGELATGSFSFNGNDHSLADAANEFITDGRTINAAATTPTLNGSVDMPFLASSAIGTLDNSSFALQSVELELDNNLNAQTVIGEVAPIDYSAGTAAISVNLSAYSTDSSWSVLSKKLTQDPFALGFMVKNSGGWYGFFLPAVQVSFEDPASGGANQDIILDMSGTAKVGASGESALVIYKS